MTLGPNALWLVAKTQPQKETVASTHLARQGLETFLPRYRKTIRKGSRFTDLWRPLFPGYVFIAAGDDPAIWRQIGGTRGIAYLVGFGRTGRPAIVPEAIMGDLLAISDPDSQLPADRGFAVGDQVEIERGPFSGLTARILSLNDRGRVELLLEIMGGVAANLGVDQLRSA